MTRNSAVRATRSGERVTMNRTRRLRQALLVAPTAGALIAGATSCTSTRPLTFTGMGPLTIGMTERQAVATGWLSDKTEPWCELGGGTRPDPGYQLDGPKAPQPIQGRAVFHDGRLETLMVSSGASTAQGIWPWISTVSDVDKAYPKPAYTTSGLDIFGHHLVTVRPSGEPYPSQLQLLVDATPQHRVQAVGVPHIPFCE